MNEDLINRITYYLSSGGLFNSELADHLAVRNLLMECREALAQRTWVNATTWRGLTDGEVDKMILLMGFPPDWITENAIVKNIVRNLEAKLKDKNNV